MRFNPVRLAIAALILSLAACESMDLVWSDQDGGLAMSRYIDDYGATFDEYANHEAGAGCVRDAERAHSSVLVPAGKRVRVRLSSEHSGFVNVLREPAEIARCGSDFCGAGAPNCWSL